MTDLAGLDFDPLGGAPVKKSGGRLATIGGVVAVTLLAVGAGAGTAFLIATPTAAPPAETAEEHATAEAEPAENPAAYGAGTGPLILVPMEPIVTNIASPPATIIRVEASLVVRAEEAGDPAILAAQIGADTLAFARSLELAQIEGARGLLHLREDLKERAMLRSPAVADYVIHALIAQ